mmetsp:Transcript_14403/g.29813  ORF Transcript_14403/g.29813 Transcript_14403/m.29813 type:complete len:223 (+) Transcript_14403:97-765(+)
MNKFLFGLILSALALAGHVGALSMKGPETRRGFASSVASVVAGSSALLIDPYVSRAEVPLATYEDTNCKFKINVPSEWVMTEQTLPDRRKIVLYFKPESNQKTLMFIAYTPARDDFTSLGSFGSVDEVAQATILPKAEIAAKQGIESEMLTAVTKKKAYFFDYVQSTSVQPKTHFRTIFSLAQGATGGAGSLLVSITVQTPESDYAAMEPLFQKILDSYEPS